MIIESEGRGNTSTNDLKQELNDQIHNEWHSATYLGEPWVAFKHASQSIICDPRAPHQAQALQISLGSPCQLQ